MAQSSDAVGERMPLDDHAGEWASDRPRRAVLAIAAVLLLCFDARIDAQRHSGSALPDPVSPSLRWGDALPLQPSDPCLAVVASVESRGVAIAPDQHVVAVGRIAGLPTVVAVVKYDAESGERLWCESFPLEALSATGTLFPVPFAEVAGLAIDASGTIVIGGHGTTGPAVLPYPQRPGLAVPAAARFFVTRCSSSGACDSTVTFIDPAVAGSHNDRLGGIAVGPDGNPVLTGLAEFPSASAKRSTFTLLTVKIDGSTLGHLATAQASSNPPGPVSTQDVAVDASNGIFVTGTEGATLKYDSALSSTPVWTRRLAGARIAAGNHRHRSQIALLQVAGNATSGVGVATLDGESGATIWTNTYGSGLNDVPRDIARDDRGNIVVTADLSARQSGPAGKTTQGQVVSLSATGNVNWVVRFPTAAIGTGSSIAAVAVGLDGDPVVSGHSPDGSSAAVVVMSTLKYNAVELAASAGDGFDAAGDPHGHDDRLAWDHPINEMVTGFRVCIDDGTGAACQDVGGPDDLNAGITSSTPPGSRTYEIALSKLTAFSPGKRQIVVVAYNDAGHAESAMLTVQGH